MKQLQNKNIKYYFIIISLIIFTVADCIAQNNNFNNKVLIFKIEYYDNSNVEYCYSEEYSLLEINQINNFKIIKNDSIESPNILYNITYNGGLVFFDPIDIYTIGCCEYGSVNKAIDKLIHKNLSKDTVELYKETNKIELNSFSNYDSYKLSFIKGPIKYNIIIWVAELKYCICDLYMSSPSQEIYGGNQGAYLKSIVSINKPSKEIKMQVKKILKKIVKIDFCQ